MAKTKEGYIEKIALSIANTRRRERAGLPPMNITQLKKDSCYDGLKVEAEGIMAILDNWKE